jgi:hypothetical protein
MPVKQAETSSWRWVEKVFMGGDVAGGSRVMVELDLGIDIFEFGWILVAVETGGAFRRATGSQR